MAATSDPKWLRFLSRRLQWLAISNIAMVFVGIQAFGFLLVLTRPTTIELLPLVPDLVLQGQIWRLLTFLAVPMAMSPLWMIFALMFQYFVLNSIEAEWGEFKTSLYVVTSIVVTVIFSIIFDYPVTSIANFSSTLFLAAAALFPEHEIRIYFAIPVKMKVLGWLALAFFLFRLLTSDWMDRLFLLATYSNYLIFFGPALLQRFHEWKRRKAFKANWK